MTAVQHTPGLVGIPTLEWLWAESAATFVRLMQWVPIGSQVSFVTGSHSVANKRNAIAKRMLADPALQWVLYLDSDAAPPPETALTLLQHQVEVVAGSFVNRGAPYTDVYAGALGEGPGGLMEVEDVGFHCVLVRRCVLERMAPPWFDHGDTPGVSEDFYFCQKARAAGAHIYIDRTLEVGHLTMTNVTPTSAREYQQTPTGRAQLARAEAAISAQEVARRAHVAARHPGGTP